MYKTAGFAATLVAAGLFAFAPALAQQRQMSSSAYGKLTSSEKQDLRTAASSAMAQIDLAQVAERQSSNARVKQLASQIVSDQTKSLNQIRDYAMRNNVVLPSQVSSKDRAQISRLSSESGTQFDRTFFNEIQKHQNSQMAALNKLDTSGNPQLQQLAANLMPDIQQQQTSVSTEMASLGIPSTATPMTDPAAVSKLKPSEKRDLVSAASASLAQIHIARTVEARSTNAEVKSLAGKIVTDQTKALDQMRSYASANHVTLPTKVSSKEQKHINALSRMSGDSLDRTFFRDIETQQNRQMAALRKMESTSNPQLRELASSIMPGIREQQSAVSSQMASMGIPSTTKPLTDESQTQYKHKKAKKPKTAPSTTPAPGTKPAPSPAPEAAPGQ